MGVPLEIAMPHLSRRPFVALFGLLASALYSPPPATAWGTLTGGLHLSEADQKKLKDLIANYGEETRKAIVLGELSARIGAHPIHQFIVQQALLMLQEDPAIKDGQPGLPDVKAINAWDGVERCEHGMRPTNGPGLVHDAPDLTPILGGAAGPGPDSELAVGGDATAPLGYNPLYNGRAHYFSPFLGDGQAPAQAAANYSRLVTTIVDGIRGEPLPHYAAYLAHYISDPTSAKHADAFTLDAATMQAMIKHADDWVAEKQEKKDDFEVWVKTQPITDAIATLKARTSALSGASAAYWGRVDRHIADIGGTPLFQREGVYAWLAPSSLRSAVACYLRELANRPEGKSLDQFYTYFDPFYFNGPVLQVKKDWSTSYHPPSFEACTAFSEHLFWETNPGQGELVKAWTGKATPWLGGGDPRAHYVAWAPAKGFLDLDAEIGRKALEETMAALVERCSNEAHGGLDDGRDWEPGFEGHLKVAIRCVATAFRASISAIRAESWGRRVNDGADIRLQLSVASAGGVPGKLRAARVSILDPATKKLASRPGWSFALGDRALGEEPTDVGVLVEGVPDGVAPSDLVVDLRADFGALPDSGRARVPVTARGTKKVYNPSAGGLSAAKGPVDVVVVMDTTGSMGGSLDDLRRNAISSIQRLRERSSDLRLAVSVFRDLEEKDDLPFFASQPFSRDIDAQFAFLNGLSPGGGGDTPEDQLHGISVGLRFWETETPDPDRVPTKIIVVITDAPAKSPDSAGNDFESIARRAEEVDPAHIYPIVVGRDAAAAKHAEELAAKTGGRVLSAKSGEEVAEALIAAVDEAVVSYAAPAPTGGTRWALVAVALLLLAAASLLAGMALRAGRRARRATTGGL